MAPGKTRTCPHCKATILESATVCPGMPASPEVRPRRAAHGGCGHAADGGGHRPASEGGADAWEYSIVLSVRNGRGEEITRQVVGVGVLAPDDVRSFSLAVEMFAPQTLARDARAEQRAGRARRPARPAGREPLAVPRSARTRGRGRCRCRPVRRRAGRRPCRAIPRPPAPQTQVRTLPVGAQPVKDRPKQ